MVYSDQIRLLNPALPRRQVLYQYGYAMDPDPVMSCSSLNTSARLTYRAILRLCGRGTSCRVSVDQIASQAGVSARSVQRHITTLTLRGLIETEEEPGFPTIYRLLPLPGWLVAGRKPVLPVESGPERGDRGGERAFPPAGSIPPTMPQGRGEEDGPGNHPGGLPSTTLSSAPEGRQDGGGEVKGCQRGGEILASSMVYKENKLENPISLSGHGTQSGTEGTDPTPMPERERVGEALSPVLGESKAAPPATPQQIVQATCQTLGFRPTGAQVSFGVREVADLCVDGFSLLEIAQGARYVAEQGWVRSFAGVKYYLPQALTRLALKAAQERDTSSACRGMGERDEDAGLSAGVSRSEAAEQSPHRALWDRVREKIAPRIHPQSYRTWFAPTYIADYDGQRVVLNVPSLFFLDWLEEHYLALIEAVFEEVLGRAVEVFFQTPEGGG